MSSVSKKKYKSGLPIYHSHAAGIDVGDTRYDVALNEGEDPDIYEVATFGSTTGDLEELVSWLQSKGIETVAIESTGIYWVNLYLFLEKAGIVPYLVNARHVKNVTGRKRDDSDAIWLAKLHSCGLLQNSFQPGDEVRTLRDYMRHRKTLINTGADATRRMQKALELLNIKVQTVISDILGKTGMRIIKAIIAGERDPSVLALLADPRIKADPETIKRSLKGIWREEYLFMLQQSYQQYQFTQSQLKACDKCIENWLLTHLAQVLDGDISDLPEKKSPGRTDGTFRHALC